MARALRLGRRGRRFESYFRDQYIVIAKLDRAGGVQLSGLGSSPSQYINSSHSSAGRAHRLGRWGRKFESFWRDQCPCS